MQGDCEKLNVTTSNLIKDHRQKQKDIDVRAGRVAGSRAGARSAPRSLFSAPSASQVLYQGLEKLEKEKADREHLEMEIDVVRPGLKKGHPGRSHRSHS